MFNKESSKRRPLIIIIGASALLGVLISLVLSWQITTKHNLANKNEKQAIALPSVKPAEESKEPLTFNECLKIASPDIRDACIFSAFQIDKDAQYCQQIMDIDKKDSCFSIAAIDQGCGNLCSNLISEDSMDKCYLDVALGTENVYLCEEIIDSDMQNSCNDQLKPAE